MQQLRVAQSALACGDKPIGGGSARTLKSHRRVGHSTVRAAAGPCSDSSAYTPISGQSAASAASCACLSLLYHGRIHSLLALYRAPYISIQTISSSEL